MRSPGHHILERKRLVACCAFLALAAWGAWRAPAAVAGPASALSVAHPMHSLGWPCPEPIFAQQPIPKPQPAAKPKPRSQGRGEGIDWVWVGIIGGAIVLAIGAGVVFWIQQQGSDQKKKKGVVATEYQIDGYRLVNLIMTGQTSQVWEVVEVISNRHFAMKLLLPETARDATHRRLLYHEAEVGLKLAHPNVVKIVKLVRDNENPYFLMEFFPAGSVKSRLMQKQHAFIKEKAYEIVKQAATSLAYMNANGWVHRDVKPDNFLVNAAGELRLIDFALAQRVQKPSLMSKLFKPKKTAGTRSYMSPEQIRCEPLDGRADIYSFGAALYEIFTGRPPFRGASSGELLNKHLYEKPITPQAHNPELTDEFSDLILRMLAKKREDRPGNFHEVLMQFRDMKIYKTKAPQKTRKE